MSRRQGPSDVRGPTSALTAFLKVSHGQTNLAMMATTHASIYASLKTSESKMLIAFVDVMKGKLQFLLVPRQLLAQQRM